MQARSLLGEALALPLLLAAATFVLSMLVTGMLWTNAKNGAMNRLQAEFEFRSEESVKGIIDRMETYHQVLRGVAGFMEGSVAVDRTRFQTYVAALRLSENYPGIQGIALSEIVPRNRLAQHVGTIRRQGFPEYRLHPFDKRETYTAITHIEPFNAMNRRAFGFDMFSEPVRRAAMERARDTGSAALSGKVTLVQEAASDVQPGFLMYLPVFKNGMQLRTMEERRAGILGWVYAPFRVNDFMAGLGGARSAELGITIYDGDWVSGKSCLFGCAEPSSREPLFMKTTRVNIVGRTWTIKNSSATSFEARLDRRPADLIALLGSFISLLLALLVWALASRRDRALAMAVGMTKELRASEARWKFALEGNGDGIWEWASHSGRPSYSAQWLALLGYEEGDVVSDMSGWMSLIHPTDRPHVVSLIEDLLAGKISRYSNEHRMLCKDGRWKWMLSRAMVVERDENGKTVRLIGIHADISERKEAEQRELVRQQHLEKTRSALQQAQKLEAIGRMTGGIAHDFNNLLQVISGNIQLLLYGQHDAQQTKSRLDSVMAAVEKGTQLPAQLLAFARRQPLHPVPVDLVRLVKSNFNIFCSAAGESVRVETVFADGVWNALADPSQLENVLMNLVFNARDAMPEGGTLTIELGNAVLDGAYVHAHPEAREGEYAVISVSDTGCGMSEEVLKQAFEPFFTTKPEGKGAGLGLSMAYGFVTQSGGHIRIDSEETRGTRIRICLPRSHAKQSNASSLKNDSVVGGDETILLVEDNLAVQETGAALLAELGYRVLKADDGQSAWTILQSGVHIDVLFTDVIMPGALRGAELAQRAKELRPDIAVLFASGYTRNEIEVDGKLADGVTLLRKPYKREELAQKIRQVIAARCSGAIALQSRPVAE
ncbi:MAG: CHASE domain-containing protein [Burkholderiaceae bacterium]